MKALCDARDVVLGLGAEVDAGGSVVRGLAVADASAVYEYGQSPARSAGIVFVMRVVRGVATGPVWTGGVAHEPSGFAHLAVGELQLVRRC